MIIGVVPFPTFLQGSENLIQTVIRTAYTAVIKGKLLANRLILKKESRNRHFIRSEDTARLVRICSPAPYLRPKGFVWI
jgi:hypothetical protein